MPPPTKASQCQKGENTTKMIEVRSLVCAKKRRQMTPATRDKFPSPWGNTTDRFGGSQHSSLGPGRKVFGSPGNEGWKNWKAVLEGGDVLALET